MRHAQGHGVVYALQKAGPPAMVVEGLSRALQGCREATKPGNKMVRSTSDNERHNAGARPIYTPQQAPTTLSGPPTMPADLQSPHIPPRRP